ncbi:MAG: putative toxin-antitoxin system toxin component, PIN family [Comamonadaceae bacterium]|nr:putative toxin-antitoxin system toxin component, PIN family [Comamonadaceae bacterium]
MRPPRALVLDTNIVLDMLLFGDPAAAVAQAQLWAALAQPAPRLHWIATEAMRAELAHVLAYAHLQPRMAHYQRTAADILAQFDAAATLVDAAAETAVRCRDGDDQKFIDLAIAHRAVLLSKDRQVLKLRKRLARLDVLATAALPQL